MTSVSAGSRRRGYEEAGDRALVELARGGDTAAFAELWARHRAAATGAARCITSTIDPDDLVAEAYAVILEAIRRGGGPTGDGFRPYLYTTVRNLARRWGSRRREIAVDELPEEAGEDLVLDGQIGSLDQRLVRDAFRSLPARWREVLWCTEVEGMAPAEVGTLLGVNANAAAVLAFRAREGLRRAWLQAHVADALGDEECRWVRARIGEHSRDGLGKRAAARVDAHLASCRACRDIALEVGQVGRQLARVLVPLLIGSGPAIAWFAAPGAPAVAASGAAAGAVGTAAASGAVPVATGAALAAAAVTVLAAFGGIQIDEASAAAPPPAPAVSAAAPVEALPEPVLAPPRTEPPVEGTGPLDGVLGASDGISGLPGAIAPRLEQAVDRVEQAIETATNGQLRLDLDGDPSLPAPNLSTEAIVGEDLITIDLDLGGEGLVDLDLGGRGLPGLELQLLR